MATARIQRRAFLVGSAATIAGGSLVWALRDSPDPLAALLDSEPARRIGARYAAHYPEGERALWRGAPPSTEAEWMVRLDELRRLDFEADRLVEVDGWWLTETELRFCVLLHSQAASPD